MPCELLADKTQGSPGVADFNEKHIEDKTGAERIFVHGQRDRGENIQHNRKIHVGNECHDMFKQIRVSNWGDAHEVAFSRRLLSAAAAINPTVATSIVFGFTQPQGAVRTGRNTFILDE